MISWATAEHHKAAVSSSRGAKSLIRMFRPRGNPQARNLFGIIGYLQRQAGIKFHVTPGPT
jgi:hypothetical protein